MYPLLVTDTSVDEDWVRHGDGWVKSPTRSPVRPHDASYIDGDTTGMYVCMYVCSVCIFLLSVRIVGACPHEIVDLIGDKEFKMRCWDSALT